MDWLQYHLGRAMRDTTMAVTVLAAALLACAETDAAKEVAKDPPPSAAESKAKSDALYTYRKLMAATTADPPGMLDHMVKDAGRRPDMCKRSNTGDLDVCFWFFMADDSTKVFSYSLAADGEPGSNPHAVVKLVVFAHNNEVERKVDGALMQLIGK